MTGRMIKLECRRAFQSRAFLFAVGTGILFTLWHFFRYGWPLIEHVLAVHRGTAGDAFFQMVNYGIPVTQTWMGTSNMGYELYFFLLPVLCAIPYGASYVTDLKSGYICNIITRTDSRTYRRGKLAAVFLSGGAVSVIPLIFNLILCMCFVPVMFPLAGTRLFAVTDASLLSGLFYSGGTFIYILIYLLFDFVFFGLLNALCLIMAWFEDNRFAVMLTPFMVYFAVHMVCVWGFQQNGWSPVTYTFFPALLTEHVFAAAVELLILAVLAALFVRGRKEGGL